MALIVRLGGPLIINWCYALLFWREYHRPKYDKVWSLWKEGETAQDPDCLVRYLLEAIYPAADINTQDIDKSPCLLLKAPEGRNILHQLYLYRFFKDAGPEEITQLFNIGRWIAESPTLHSGLLRHRNYYALLNHLADEAERPFFHTPQSLANLISSLASYYVNKDHNHKEPKLRVYDPCVGYGELLMSMPRIIAWSKEIYMHHEWNSAGERMYHLPWWCFHLFLRDVKEQQLMVDKGDKVDLIVTNPPHPWIHSIFGYDWEKLYEYINLLEPGGIFITTFSKYIWDNPLRNDEHYRASILKTRHLKLIIQLPQGLLRGTSEAPLLLVFIKRTNNQILYINGAGVGYQPNANSRYFKILEHNITRLVQPNGLLYRFDYQINTVFSNEGPWAVSILHNPEALLKPNTKFDEIFYKTGDI